MNPQCPVFKTEQIHNQIDFVKHKSEGMHVISGDTWQQEFSVDASKSQNLIGRRISLQYGIKVT